MVEFWARRCPCCVRIATRAGSMVDAVVLVGVTGGPLGVSCCFDEEILRGGGGGGGRLFGVGDALFSFSALIFRAAARLLEIRFCCAGVSGGGVFGGLGPGVLGSGVRVIMRDSRSARRASNDALSVFIALDRKAFWRRSMARAVSRVKIVGGLMVLSLGREAEVSLGSRFSMVSFF